MSPHMLLALPRRALNMARGLVQRHGSAALKQRLWDWEFHHRRWTCLDDTPDDPAYPYLTRYANHGRILDLGCGPGNTGRYLNAAAYSAYTGVDISQVAIDRARTDDPRPQNRYEHSDLLAYQPDGAYEVILLGDSLYYIPKTRAVGMLERYRQHLSTSGVFIVKMHDTPSLQPFFEMIRRRFTVIGEFRHDPVVLLVFRVLMLIGGTPICPELALEAAAL